MNWSGRTNLMSLRTGTRSWRLDRMVRMGLKGFLVWGHDKGVTTERGGTCVSGLERAEVVGFVCTCLVLPGHGSDSFRRQTDHLSIIVAINSHFLLFVL